MAAVRAVTKRLHRRMRRDFAGHASKQLLWPLEMLRPWRMDVPDGDVTSMYQAVAKMDDETFVVGRMIWPDKAVAGCRLASLRKRYPSWLSWVDQAFEENG